MDKIVYFLEQEAFAGYTWMEIGIAAIGAFVLVKLIGWVRKPRYTDPNQVSVRCAGCGWRGRVGKYNKVCPGCGSHLP